MEGLVLSGSNNAFQVRCEDGAMRRCNIKGKVLAQNTRYYNPLAPGDVVELELDKLSFDEALIVNLKPRKNFFPRLNIKTKTPQVLAANIDALVCLTTPNQPEFRPIFVDRVLVQASHQDIPVYIVLNKCDIGISENVGATIAEWERLGFKVFRVSAKHQQGIKEFLSAIHQKTICVMGQSGVGKSTLLNAIEPSLNLVTANISKSTNKGSHTTTRSVLYEIAQPNLQVKIIDTPGIKNFSLYNIQKQDIALHFPEISDLVGSCKFGISCTHIRETSCAILRSLDEGRFSPQRYKSYLNMVEEL